MKNYVATHPNGFVEKVTGLVEFCKEYGLTAAKMTRVALGKQTNHKGYGCRYADPNTVQRLQKQRTRPIPAIKEKLAGLGFLRVRFSHTNRKLQVYVRAGCFVLLRMKPKGTGFEIYAPVTLDEFLAHHAEGTGVV